jgi:purine-binding chemotaxis protein CheW
MHDLLAVGIGSERCAIRLSEVTGLFVDRRITRIPAGHPALLGIASFRGAIAPVYSLLTLLGHSGIQSPRWLIVAALAPIALAFDQFDGHLRVPAAAILPQQSHGPMRGYAPDFIRSGNAVLPVLQLASIIAAVGPAGPAAPES